MRIKFLISILFIFTFCPLAAQFIWSNPQPSGYTNNRIVFTDRLKGFIINANGDLIKTRDAGATWSIQKNFSRCGAMDVKDSFVIIGGADTLVHLSNDGGVSWKTGVIPQNQVIIKFQILNKDTVFALSKNSSISTSKLFQTVDGGLSWKMMNESVIINDMDFINSRLGFAASSGGVHKTVDGGVTWLKSFDSANYNAFKLVKFFDERIGYACPNGGEVYRTTDGGATWTLCLASMYSAVNVIKFVDAATIFLGGVDGAVYRSTDSGKTWQLLPTHVGYGYGIHDMYFSNTNEGFLVGVRGQILSTTDGGNSFKDNAPTYIDIKPISFPGPATGYAASWNNILKTTDAGTTWKKLAFSLADPTARFQHLTFFSRDTGIAVSESPVQVFKTYNGGQNWHTITLPIIYKDNIDGLFRLGNTLYASVQGAYGYTMLRSKDRGENWSVQSQGPKALKNLFFIDERTGYANMGPSLYKTTDSAKTWSLIFNNNEIINSIWFVNPSTGYLGGGYGYNHVTFDSGRTWQRFQIWPGNFNFYTVFAIRFFNDKVGYLTSENGGVYKTFDGGRHWIEEKSTPWNCKTIEMASDTSLYITGESGTILKKDMREYAMDSLIVIPNGPCGPKASVKITAVLSSVDSVWFEYGQNNFSHIVNAIPVAVKDTSLRCTAALPNLAADKSYKIRVKILYRNAYYYSNAIIFQSSATQSTGVVISASSTQVCTGFPVTFSVKTVGQGATVRYQWQVNNKSAGTNDSVFVSATLNNNDQVRCILTSSNICGTVLLDSSNTIVIATIEPLKTSGKAIVAQRSCLNKPFPVSFRGIQTPDGSVVELWEKVDSLNYLSLGSQTYSGAILNFGIESNNKPAVRKYFFVITPPASKYCVTSGNSDTVTTVTEGLAVPVIVLNGNMFTVTNPDANAVYQWQFQSSGGSWKDVVGFSSGLSFTATVGGNYRVSAEKGACVEYSGHVNVGTIGSIEEVKIYLYPNPTSDILVLDSLKLSDNWETLEIKNGSTGIEVMRVNITGQTKVTVHLNSLSDGTYFAVFRRKNGSYELRKFVKIS